MRFQRLFRNVAVALAVLLAVVALAWRQPFAFVRLRDLCSDALTRAGRTAPADPNLVFLAIDSDSVNLDPEVDGHQLYGINAPGSLEGRAFKLMSQRFPWPREVYALVLERLVNAGAKVVAFDLTFPTSTDGDAPFRDALDKYRDHVIIGSNFVDPSWTSSSRAGASHTRPPDSLIPQSAPLDDRIAYTNFWPDTDEVVRRAQYQVTFEQVEGDAPRADSERFLSLAARSLVKADSAGCVPADLSSHVFRFAGKPRSGFPPHSLFEIFVPAYWKFNYRNGEFFRNKIVVIGAEGNWQHDEHLTPLGSMPGPELHLNAINAALQSAFITEMSARGALALAAVAAAVAFILSMAISSALLRLGCLLLCNGLAAWLALLAFNKMSLLLPMVDPLLQLNTALLLGFVSDFTAERVEKKRIRHTLERYVSKEVARRLLDQPKLYSDSLGGVLRPATILFSDIRDFSQVSARTDPHTLVTQLNEYFTAMVDCVFASGGTLDKFIGDAVMAVWGNVASAGHAADAQAAVRAALAMRAHLVRLNARWRERGWPELRMGIAINHGEVIVGNIGSPQRMEFTVIGDAVNVTWKLQELTKKHGCDLIVSQMVADLVVEHFEMHDLGTASVAGLTHSHRIFGLQGPLAADSNFARADRRALISKIAPVGYGTGPRTASQFEHTKAEL